MNSLTKILLFYLLIVSSCKNKSDTIGNAIGIDIYNNRIESIQASKLCRNISFIPLSSEEGHLFGDVSKIIKTDKFYFILDAKYTKSIYAFNVDGTFFNAIGSNGKGPGEYLNPIDFVVDPANETVIVLDQFRKIVKIDYSGNLLVEHSLPKDAMFIEGIYMFNDVLFASTGKIKYNKLLYQILQFDKSFNIVNHFLPYETGNPFHYTYENKFFNLSDDLYFVDVFENKIYMYDGDFFVMKYILNFSNKDVTFEQVRNDNFEFLNSESSAYLFDSCVAGDSILFLPVFLEGKPHYGFLKICSDNYYLIEYIDNDLLTFHTPLAFHDSKFISIGYSYNFDEAFPNSGLNVLPSDNPVIIEYALSIR